MVLVTALRNYSKPFFGPLLFKTVYSFHPLFNYRLPFAHTDRFIVILPVQSNIYPHFPPRTFTPPCVNRLLYSFAPFYHL